MAGFPVNPRQRRLSEASADEDFDTRIAAASSASLASMLGVRLEPKSRKNKKTPGPQPSMLKLRIYYLPDASELPVFRKTPLDQRIMQHTELGYGFPDCCLNKESMKIKPTFIELSDCPTKLKSAIVSWFPSLEGRTYHLCRMKNANNKSLEVMDWDTSKKIASSKFKGIIILRSGQARHTIPELPYLEGSLDAASEPPAPSRRRRRTRQDAVERSQETLRNSSSSTGEFSMSIDESRTTARHSRSYEGEPSQSSQGTPGLHPSGILPEIVEDSRPSARHAGSVEGHQLIGSSAERREFVDDLDRRYNDSLMIDQLKAETEALLEAAAAAEIQRMEQLTARMIQKRDKLDNEPGSDNAHIQVSVRHPTEGTKSRRFVLDHVHMQSQSFQMILTY